MRLNQTRVWTQAVMPPETASHGGLTNSGYQFKACVPFVVLLTLWVCVGASTSYDFISLPPEFAAKVPARLVFSLPELVQCWQDATAKRCVLKDSIVIDQSYWRQSFKDTAGIAEVTPDDGTFTLTSEVCAGGGLCLPGSTSRSYTLDFNEFASSMFVKSGAVLLLSNVQLFNLAPQSAYGYITSQPYKSTGQGTTTWPSIALAPNAELLLINSSVLYFNPSDTDDCVAYTQKRIFAFRQVWGESNITQINSTSNLIVGPQNITVTIRNASTDAIVGNASVLYKNVTFTCMPNVTLASPSGSSPGALAAAIAVPIGVVLLAGCLLLVCCIKRRRQRQRHQHETAEPKLELGLLGDMEGGQLPVVDGTRDVQGEGSNRGRDQRKLVALQHKGDSFSSSEDAALQADAAVGLQHDSTCGREHFPSAEQEIADLEGVGIIPSDNLNQPQPQLQLQPVQGTGVHGSGGALDSGIAHGSGGMYEVSACSTGLPSQPAGSVISRSSVTTGMDDRLTSVSALLKARSDMAVLRDLKIGPLLGRGSYGRVYKGRWKATPVAVKIIEHHAVGMRSSGGKTISAGREALLATSVSHPNVVTTHHISTMSMSQRSAIASSWLEGGAGPSSSQQIMQDMDDSPDDGGSEGSTISSDLDESPPDLMETWIILEYCERGSLERAVRLGKFKRKMDGPEGMVGIYKALLDTASGLDYLHSIGVVHGDLKTANVLLKGNTRDARGVTCKITDFGLSRVLDPEATHISTGTYGTIVYMPKELLLSGRMTQATDIYSFGLMMWELFAGQPVMEEGLSIGQMFYMIAYENWRPALPEGCPKAYADLMTACWREDPDQRPTAQQLLRRLQRLYLQAKQNFLASRAGPSQASGQGTAAAAAAGPSHAGYDIAPAALSSGSPQQAGDFASAAVTADADAARLSSDSNTSPHPSAQREQQQGLLARGGSGRVQPFVRHTSSRMTSSIEEGSSIDAAAPATARTSIGSVPEELEGYQPYSQAVLQRAASTSSPVIGRALTARPLGSAAGDGVSPRAASGWQQPGLLPLQQLAQLQDPSAQLELLAQHAVFMPPMLPTVVSSGTQGPMQTQQGDGGCEPAEELLFDEDGMASESLLRQLTSPTNAVLGGEAEEQYSGYLYPTNAADTMRPATQPMQPLVDLYREQLQHLQQQAAAAGVSGLDGA